MIANQKVQDAVHDEVSFIYVRNTGCAVEENFTQLADDYPIMQESILRMAQL